MKKKMLANAIALAADAHKDQFDKGGKPYILHPLKVMHYLKTEDDFELMCIAVLHDVVEDCGITYLMLYEAGFSERVIAALRLLTKVPGQTNEEYLAGIMTNIDAVRVKLADLRHNMDARRLKGITPKDSARMDKYCKMYAALNDHLKVLEAK